MAPPNYLLMTALSWAMAFVATAIMLSLLRRFAVMDMPNERSNHKTVTPRGGGIAIVLPILVLSLPAHIEVEIITALLLLATVSFTDDLKGLSVRWRLLAQLIAVAIAMPALHGRILPDFIPPLLEYIIIGLSWVWFINLTNFMDGIDGITSMQVIMTAVGICLTVAVSPTLPLWLAGYSAIIAAATLGFFWFNRHPAKLFMGDVGSITLGFLMFFLLASLAAHDAILAALILPAYYISDATFTLLKRLARGDKIWQAHSEHAYQKSARSGKTHIQVVRRITLLNTLLIILAIASTTNLATGIAMLIFAYIATGMAIRCMLQGK